MKVYGTLDFAQLQSSASDIASPATGLVYFNTVSQKPKYYTGTEWKTVATTELDLNRIFVGNPSNAAAQVDTSSVGDILGDATTGLTIKSNVIVNADINTAAAISGSKITAGTNVAPGVLSIVAQDISGVKTFLSGLIPQNGHNVFDTCLLQTGSANTTNTAQVRSLAYRLERLGKKVTLTMAKMIQTDKDGSSGAIFFGPGGFLPGWARPPEDQQFVGQIIVGGVAQANLWIVYTSGTVTLNNGITGGAFAANTINIEWGYAQSFTWNV